MWNLNKNIIASYVLIYSFRIDQDFIVRKDFAKNNHAEMLKI